MSALLATARRNLDLIALNLALLLAASAMAGGARALYRNSLSEHPIWKSTKPALAMKVMGARRYMLASQAVVRNRLDLSAWFGFQEVVYDRPLMLSEMDVNVEFEPDGYVNVLYDVRRDGYSGVRLSNRQDLPSIQFRATPEGEFLSEGTLARPALVTANRKHALRLLFDTARAHILLDGRDEGSFPRTGGPQRIGFRGGLRAAWVDDIVLRLSDGTIIREAFTLTRHRVIRVLAVFCLLGATFGLAGFLLDAWFSVPARQIGLWMVIGSVALVAVTAGTYAHKYLARATYDATDLETQRISTHALGVAQTTLAAELRRKYGYPPGDSVYRILFLGSSQTWGAGATRENDVWVRQLERMLNNDDLQLRVECVNAGVSGLLSPQVLGVARNLRALSPHAAVITLSNNDVDTAVFRANVDSMVTVLTSSGIATVLLLEPNSPERRVTDSHHGDLAVKHRIMAEVGNAHGVPVIDLHQYLASKNRAGFLWWDFVHLTTYGQRLVAAKLHSTLPALLHLQRALFAQSGGGRAHSRVEGTHPFVRGVALSSAR